MGLGNSDGGSDVVALGIIFSEDGGNASSPGIDGNDSLRVFPGRIRPKVKDWRSLGEIRNVGRI